MPEHGVIIANTGSPAAPTPEAVRAYLADFLRDPRIRPMNALAWNLILNAFVLPRRSVASAKKYERIWAEDGSPLVMCMQSLASKLDARLDGLADGYVVRHAMSYGEPSMAATVRKLRDEGCEDLVAIALYPQSAYSTSYVVEDKLRAALADAGWDVPVRFIGSYSDSELYRDAIAQAVVAAGFDAQRDQLLMAFHSVPMKDIVAGDTYDEQVLDSSEAIASRLGIDDEELCIGFQCRFDKSRKWLSPSTTEALEALDPSKRLFVVAPNFSIDCLETLFDIEVVMRGQWEAMGGTEFTYVPCLNDTPAHVELLKSLVIG